MPVRESGFRSRGRPPVEGALNGAERKTLTRQRVKVDGGRDLSVVLGASAWQALQKLAPKGERGPLIERLILAELNRREKGLVDSYVLPAKLETVLGDPVMVEKQWLREPIDD